jgi:hypothetical protein
MNNKQQIMNHRRLSPPSGAGGLGQIKRRDAEAQRKKPFPMPLSTGEGSSAKGMNFAIPQKGMSSTGGTPPLLWRELVPMYREGWGERFFSLRLHVSAFKK